MSSTLPSGTRFVVHIGRHKTGTSSLQRALHAQTDQLAARDFYYVAAGRDPHKRGQPTMIAHHALASELKTGKPGPVTEALIAEARERPGVFIISSEALQNVSPADLALAFPPQETVVIAYLREQVSYLVSAFAQRVQATDYAAPFAEYVDAHLKQLDYVPHLETLVEEFGVDRVMARAYDATYLAGGNTIRDFYSILGIDLEPPPGDGNPSINENTILVKRLMNVCKTDQFGPTYNRLPKLTEPLGGERSVAISAERQAEIRTRFAAPNRELFARYFDLPDGAFTLNDYSRDETTYSADEVVALVKTAFEELGKPE